MGRQSENRILGHHLVAVLLILVMGVLISNEGSNAQQLYNATDYSCSDSGNTSCGTFALYKVQPGTVTGIETLAEIAVLFDTNLTVLGILNGLQDWNIGLASGIPIIVPLLCSCSNQTSYANLPYRVQLGDTFYGLSSNTFEALTTIAAISQANPTVNASNLQLGDPLIIPLRCACPSVKESTAGVKSLVTYPIVSGDSPSLIATAFDVSTQSILNANTLNISNVTIYPQTTLLVPITTSTPHYTSAAGLSSSTPAVSPSTSASGLHRTSKIGGYVIIAVWILLALSI